MDFRQIYFLLFLCLQDQMEALTKQTQTRNDKMQLMMEQIVLSNKSSQKEKQIGKKNENSFQMPYPDVTALCLKSRS